MSVLIIYPINREIQSKCGHRLWDWEIQKQIAKESRQSRWDANSGPGARTQRKPKSKAEQRAILPNITRKQGPWFKSRDSSDDRCGDYSFIAGPFTLCYRESNILPILIIVDNRYLVVDRAAELITPYTTEGETAPHCPSLLIGQQFRCGACGACGVSKRFASFRVLKSVNLL